MPIDSQLAKAKASTGTVRIRKFIVSPRFWVPGRCAGCPIRTFPRPRAAQGSRAAQRPSTVGLTTARLQGLGWPPMPASLDEILTRLKRRYADVRRLGPKDPFEQVLYECACYLVDDARREQVWRRL